MVNYVLKISERGRILKCFIEVCYEKKPMRVIDIKQLVTDESIYQGPFFYPTMELDLI